MGRVHRSYVDSQTHDLLAAIIAKFNDAIDDEKQPNVAEMSLTFTTDARFYYTVRRPGRPEWVGFVAPVISTVSSELQSSSVSGLLVLHGQEHYFVVIFGYGRGLLVRQP